jgi:hypothetical protein
MLPQDQLICLAEFLDRNHDVAVALEVQRRGNLDQLAVEVERIGRQALPSVALPACTAASNLERCFQLWAAKPHRLPPTWASYMSVIRPADWLLVSALLECRTNELVKTLVALRIGRSSSNLGQWLFNTATKFYGQLDSEHWNDIFYDFLSFLFLGERETTGLLQRFDGVSPLGPWLWLCFRNRMISILRQRRDQPLRDDCADRRRDDEACLAIVEAFRNEAERLIQVLDQILLALPDKQRPIAARDFAAMRLWLRMPKGSGQDQYGVLANDLKCISGQSGDFKDLRKWVHRGRNRLRNNAWRFPELADLLWRTSE